MAIVKWPQQMIGMRIQKKLGKPGSPDPLGINGIYRVWHRWGYPQNLKEVFYVPFNPRTDIQQANRQKFAGAVLGWQGLTQEQKDLYNSRAEGRHMSGYNIYIREYMHG